MGEFLDLETLPSKALPLNHRLFSELGQYYLINLFTPRSDQDRVSPYKNQYNVKRESDKNKEKYQLGNC